MKLYSSNENYKLYHGNMLDMLEVIEPNSIDSIVTDPPYGLTSITKRFGKENSAECQFGKDGSFQRLSKGFMGKEWDGSGIEYNIETWQKCYEVLKPGGYLLAFGGSRTFHRIACAIEDAGFEIRDTIMWLYGSGFPKSMDISKQLDKRNGRNVNKDFMNYLINNRKKKNLSTIKVAELGGWYGSTNHGGSVSNWEKGANIPTKEQYKKLKTILDLDDSFDWLIEREEAEREVIGKQQYTNSKKFFEYDGERVHLDITIPSTDLAKQWNGWGTALKPSFEPIIVARKPFKSSLVDNVIEYGVGGINIDECRVAMDDNDKQQYLDKQKSFENTFKTMNIYGGNSLNKSSTTFYDIETYTKNTLNKGRFPANTILTYDETDLYEVCGGFPNTKDYGGETKTTPKNDIRFNASKEVRITRYKESGSASRYFYCSKASKKDRDEGLDEIKNIHPTVKPTTLCQYLIRLVTPNGGTILDPFNGSGSTGKAAMYENRERNKNYKYIGIELTEEYLPISKARIEYVCNLEPEKDMQMTIFDFIGDDKE